MTSDRVPLLGDATDLEERFDRGDARGDRILELGGRQRGDSGRSYANALREEK